MRSVISTCLVGFWVLAPLGEPAMGSSVYVVSAGLTGNGIFGTVDLNSGAFRQIGPGEPDGYFGLAPGPNGSLLSLTYNANLDSINPSTGVPTQIGPTGLGACLVPDPSCGPTSAFTMGSANGMDAVEKLWPTSGSVVKPGDIRKPHEDSQIHCLLRRIYG